MFSGDKQFKCVITTELLSKRHCFGLCFLSVSSRYFHCWNFNFTSIVWKKSSHDDLQNWEREMQRGEIILVWNNMMVSKFLQPFARCLSPVGTPKSDLFCVFLVEEIFLSRFYI